MWSSFAAAFRGLLRAWNTQAHFRFDVLVAVLLALLGFTLRVSWWEWIVLVGATGAVLALELLNTVVEFLCDLLQPRLHGSVAIIKDVAAAAVLVGAATAALVGVLLLWPHVWLLLLKLYT